MKCINTLVYAISILLFSYSCSDNNAPNRPDLPDSISDSQTYSYEILAAAGSSVTTPLELRLMDFEKLENYGRYVKTAKIRTSSKISIRGVSSGTHELQKLSLRVRGTNISKEFGNVTQDDDFNFLEDNEFIKKLMNHLIAKKTLTLELLLTSPKTIDKEVKLSLQIDAKFIF